MFIEFKKLTLKNFMSYGNSISEFIFESGMDLINAKNGNGKSAIFDALFYSLYGKPYRKIKNSALINDINKKDLLVTLEFNIDKNKYKITRGMKPNIFEIHKNNTLISQESSVKKYQGTLETNILKINEITFRQLILLGANITNSKPFLELNTVEKEEIFNSVINTTIFNNINEIIKQKNNHYKTIEIDNEYKLDLLSNSLISEEMNIEKIKNSNKNFQEQNKNKRLDLEIETAEINQKLEKLDLIIQKTKKVKDLLDYKKEKQKEVNKNVTDNAKSLIITKEKLKQIEESLKSHSVCIGCENLSKITNIDEKGDLLFKLDLLEADKELLSTEKLKIDTKIQELTDKILKTKVVLSNKKIYKNRLFQIQQEITSLDNNNTYIELNEENYNKIKNDIQSTKELLSSTKEILHNLSTLKKFILNKDLKGIIIAKRLPILNKLINEYLEKFNFSEYSMIIDSTFKEKIITSRGVEKEFNQLSNGQKFRLTQSLIFAFLKFTEIKNAVKTNILIADEVLDTSLDVDGRDDLLKILHDDFSTSKNVIIISHNTEIKAKEELFHRNININKSGNFSKIEVIK